MFRYPKQLSLDGTIARICLVCHAVNPPVEPAYGCPECGMGDTLSQFEDSKVPEVCPWCEDGKLELVVENACALCHEGTVEETEVVRCYWCGDLIPKSQYHKCPKKPSNSDKPDATDQSYKWTPGERGKVASIRLECTAKEERVRVMNGKYCEGWTMKVERFKEARETRQFEECLMCALREEFPGIAIAVDVEDYEFQLRMKPKIE